MITAEMFLGMMEGAEEQIQGVAKKLKEDTTMSREKRLYGIFMLGRLLHALDETYADLSPGDLIVVNDCENCPKGKEGCETWERLRKAAMMYDKAQKMLKVAKGN